MQNKMATQDASYQPLRRRYARYAPEYDHKWAHYSEATLARTVELIEQFHPTPRAMIDVGCGTGLLAEKIREQFNDVHITGADVSGEMLEKARQRFADDENTRWHIAPAEALPVDDHTFDLLTCTNAFHLIKEHDAALTEFKRVLQPGGTLVVTDWCRDALTIKALAFGYKVLPGHPRRIRTLDELTAVVESNGFTITHAERFDVNWFWQLSAVVAHAPNEP